jgi:hypothetical protein
MNNSLLDHVIQSIEVAKQYNSSQVTAPNVILWPDPESQWISIIDILKIELPALLTLGKYIPDHRQGPAIWLKCAVDGVLPEAEWEVSTIPVIYMPGISKADFKKIEEAPSTLLPLMEYQFTGNLWTQENGKEWTILAFMQNEEQGMGLEVAQDNATKKSLIISLHKYAQEDGEFFRKRVDADLLNELLVPQIIPNLLKWIESGNEALAILSPNQQEIFKEIIKSKYRLSLDYSLILDFVTKIGTQKGPWESVWLYFANAPHKYPKLVDFLEQVTPEDLGSGLFELPENSWPPINRQKEDALQKDLLKLKNKEPKFAIEKIEHLIDEHKSRLQWVWIELGLSPFAEALPKIFEFAKYTMNVYDIDSIESIGEYYQSTGSKIDQLLRQIYLIAETKEYKKTIEIITEIFYSPWLEKLTYKFQELVKDNVESLADNEFQENIARSPFILFVDAFRYDLALEFVEQLSNRYETDLHQGWSAIPSLTPTSKPNVSPIMSSVDTASAINDFQPYLSSGNLLTHHYFKKELKKKLINFIKTESEIDDPGKQYWMEIGDIDEKGHNEQAEMLRRVPQLLNELKETINRISQKGIKEITIVTDHGWLLLPGGLPKEKLHRDLAETRWGRCAELKEGVSTDLLQLPWTWNPNIHIAYAPGISFFKKNEEYAHGGISLQECMIPFITINVKEEATSVKAFIEAYKWIGLRLQVTTTGTGDRFSLDIRTKRDDPNSSVLLGKPKFEDSDWKLMADSDFEGQACTLILLNPRGIIVDSKLIEIGR